MLVKIIHTSTGLLIWKIRIRSQTDRPEKKGIIFRELVKNLVKKRSKPSLVTCYQDEL